MERKEAAQFDQEVLDLYDDYAHGRLNRRDYIKKLGMFAVGGMTAEALMASLSPNYAWAEQVKPDDPRIKTETVTYKSPQGAGEMKGLLAWPAKGKKFPAVLVIHENRGLNPYIADVTRRLAVDGFLAFAPDALTPLGGYPGNDDDGRAMQAKRDKAKMTEDFIAAAKFLDTNPKSTGQVGAVGFCYGGGVVYELAVKLPDVIDAGVPFYGRQPDLEDVSKIKAPLMIHNASLDKRIMAGAAPFEAELKEQGKTFEAFVYEGVNHGFHNDTTPRYDEAAAKKAWERTVAFFKKNLAEKD
ncbi:dienelactone hydrolase family protein [Gimesia sp.]|uniref:dienelactone hydrolase family protein n=1 Tax=Gimesia sp. TaxID=2024833 RepID=UPI000C46FF43|nr:dienelactone hydrolase family protein [Gimesia sp.]MAX38931.1 dienelactone hydrolase [Gimesia sp.]HBL44657.1 dienelactone hydrolase [Planctomycetaceae bacterium]|tara:strand:+ start:1334 stop:2230 length:897 start_codon:yes stop_codon:yes gene_type:complete